MISNLFHSTLPVPTYSEWLCHNFVAVRPEPQTGLFNIISNLKKENKLLKQHRMRMQSFLGNDHAPRVMVLKIF